jgi:hypothetical protein
VLHRLVYREETFFSKYVAYFPVEVVQDLILEHAIVGFTLLHHAVLAHNSVALGFFLQHGADIDAKGWRELRAIHIAYGMADDTMRVLLEDAGANVNACDEDGRTPANYATLSIADSGFWATLVDRCLLDGDTLAKPPLNSELDRREQEARAQARRKWRMVTSHSVRKLGSNEQNSVVEIEYKIKYCQSCPSSNSS